ncbi:phosphoribosylglycinamide formyltransferase [Proteinivorax hydrogeniformans]|uniref:Phosphoribosylglycinamide formyltransferase n=1 Tax=Proteinivorax hydrogeniformans TaxID=1826727 RepID=A0AAU8HS42_9FIRM
MKKLVVMASGKGSNFATILDHVKKDEINGRISALIVDKTCGAEEIAKKHNIPVFKLKTRDFTEELIKILAKVSPNYILLAGFMRILKKEVVDRYPNQIINVHPSLLPAFPGLNAVQQALNYGVKVTGCTMHFVDDKLDHGPIIAQESVSVSENDCAESLLAKIQTKEHKLYPQVVKLLCDDKITIKNRTVYVEEEKK